MRLGQLRDSRSMTTRSTRPGNLSGRITIACLLPALWLGHHASAAPGAQAQPGTVATAGHASISTTLGIYTHVVDASHRSAIEAVEERLFVETVSNCLESVGPLEQRFP
jgi:hypothetical protein